MATFIKSVDDRTRLAGTNRLEVLLFSLGHDANTGREETFGVNVFKVREVMLVPQITHAPEMPPSVEGMVSLRGNMIPVINLPKFCGVQTDEKPGILIITEYNKNVQGFLVHSVDTIERLAWENVRVPPPMMVQQHGGLVTAVTELKDGRLVMIMDVEMVLAQTSGFGQSEEIFEGIPRMEEEGITILFADDSVVARDQIIRTLDHMGIKYISTANGSEAWARIREIANRAEATGHKSSDYIQLILTDVEMPEMDGYVLTKKIKEDSRLNDIPVIMHSSLSADANQELGRGVGADAYVPKFEPTELAVKLRQMLAKNKA
ncbi:chemotaxis protein [endosymbiont of Ridgeia piscesae]|jgi:two-component system chemotaxis response regulator CheV|uniref:Chemotaxis signal transduction protein n=1 Tax=endosymbiont of Ridgeia piscesae TaxID=54398 RepID=A0A0T5YWM9_9GAMM|nr:chemotaxis protein [endosymbiont of Ridgeia piscesae]KRT54954.1 Chemotaxis signal transduction protein [endosymbiont of Ridgeia piscesae]KRT58304.1 two-component system, chemotaxis family, response regulator CheV [endosymbiont of Ridgeia piscesae]